MICYNCIEEMKPESHKTRRGIRIFLKCPKCGFNIQKSNIKFYVEQENEIYNQIKKEKYEKT